MTQATSMAKLTESAQDDLYGLVNASGFQFQLAIENLIKSVPEWQVAVTEHAWTNRDGGAGGFIDAVIENSAGVLRLVVECKRVREGRWVFLVPNDSRRIETFWTAVSSGRPECGVASGVEGLSFEPKSPQSGFCVVRGTGEGQQPMLERLAGTLLDATEALADEQLQMDLVDKERIVTRARFYVPVIITNAELFVCSFDPASVDPATGNLPDSATFSAVGVVRFIKNLKSTVGDGNYRSLQSLNAAKNRSVVVLNVAAVAPFLRSLALIGELPAAIHQMLYGIDPV
jgi:hypothetical protein